MYLVINNYGIAITSDTSWNAQVSNWHWSEFEKTSLPADTVEMLFIKIPQLEKLAAEKFLSFRDTAQRVQKPHENFQASLKAKMAHFWTGYTSLLFWGSPIDVTKATVYADMLQWHFWKQALVELVQAGVTGILSHGRKHGTD